MDDIVKVGVVSEHTINLQELLATPLVRLTAFGQIWLYGMERSKHKTFAQNVFQCSARLNQGARHGVSY